MVCRIGGWFRPKFGTGTNLGGSGPKNAAQVQTIQCHGRPELPSAQPMSESDKSLFSQTHCFAHPPSRNRMQIISAFCDVQNANTQLQTWLQNTAVMCDRAGQAIRKIIVAYSPRQPDPLPQSCHRSSHAKQVTAWPTAGPP